MFRYTNIILLCFFSLGFSQTSWSIENAPMLSPALVVSVQATEHHTVEELTIEFVNDDSVNSWIDSEILTCNECSLSSSKEHGTNALKIQSKTEFSDAYINFEKLLDNHIDLSAYNYIEIEVLRPQNSWVAALKFNIDDGKGNVGGFSEAVNNFNGADDQWHRYVISTEDLYEDFQNWQGQENPISSVKRFSFNLYTAHQLDTSAIYIRSVSFSSEKPAVSKRAALIEIPKKLNDNSKYIMDFENSEQFHRQVGYRMFESTKQAFKKGIGGRDTTAIRLLGGDPHKYIALLPEVGKMTGAPVDFTKVKRIYFSYYLMPHSDSFQTTWLYLTSDTWGDILIDKELLAYDNFTRGEWVDVSINVSDLKLELAKGSEDVLSRVEDIRLDFKYFEGRKNIEIWIDDFGWE